MSTALARAVGELPFLTRAQILAEGDLDPRFWRYLSPLALSSSPGKRIDDDMKKAVINELDPRRYPETRGRWVALRAKINGLRQDLGNYAYATGTLSDLGAAAAPTAAPDIWSSIATAIGGLGTAAANIYATKIVGDTNEDIAKIKARADAAAAETAAKIAAINAAGAAAQAGAVAASEGSSVTSYVLYALLGLLGIGGIVLLVKALGR